ncbi:MAG: lytic murein transglycosylase [Alphaproteobacteria bacterium]|nr:lytic murein transglycosylase [Alphaproteobacteria bacterium]
MKLGLSAFLAALALLVAPVASAADQNFAQWLIELRQEAKERGISDRVLDAALGNAAPIKRVIELDRRQPEFTMTFDEYLGKIASPTRARIAAQMLVEHDEILTKVSKKYGVQKRYIVTFWGVETNFGQYLGSFNVPHALATLAFDGRRSAYFRKELLNALRILEEGHIAPDKMKGSWAGAMGQSQFMPSSFLSYAVDWDGDGKRDIWGTKPDVFASTAYYLSKAGWRDDITWGRQVKLPKGFSMNGKNAKALADDKTRAKLPVWAKAGVRNADGEDLPVKNLTARLVMPAGSDGPAFLVYSNFDSILDWNRSNYYALAIGHLSDKLR